MRVQRQRLDFGIKNAMPGILEAMDRINRMDFVTKENLPLIAAIVSEIYQ